MRRRSLPRSDSDIARYYWSLPVEQRCYTQVAQHLGLSPTKRVQNAISRAIRRHEKQGLVKHTVLEVPSRHTFLDRVPEYEVDMRERFQSLRGCVVMDVAKIKPHKGEQAQEAWDDFDDHLHEWLGMWGARVLVALARRDDVIGVGGGRGPYFTAEATRIDPAWGTFVKQVVSLTGCMSTSVWYPLAERRIKPARLDADQIAQLLSFNLRARLPCQRLGPIIPPDGEQTKGRKPDTSKVDIALIGVGSLAGGHRLKRFCHPNVPRELQCIQHELQEFNDRITELEKPIRCTYPHFHLVGDVCNYLFVVDPPSSLDGGGVLAELWPKATELEELRLRVRLLNQKFLNSSPQQLAEIARRGAVIAVCGGLHKVAAINHVLNQRPPWISHLITDADVAEQLLSGRIAC